MWNVSTASVADEDRTWLHGLLGYFRDCERSQSRALRLDNIFDTKDVGIIPLTVEQFTTLTDDELEIVDPAAVEVVLKNQVSPLDQPLSLGVLWVDGRARIKGKPVSICAPLLLADAQGSVRGDTATLALEGEIYLNTSVLARLLSFDADDEDVVQATLAELVEVTPDLPFTADEIERFLTVMRRLDIGIAGVEMAWVGLGDFDRRSLRDATDIHLLPGAAAFIGRASSGLSAAEDLDTISESEVEGTALEGLYQLPDVLERGGGLSGGASAPADWPTPT